MWVSCVLDQQQHHNHTLKETRICGPLTAATGPDGRHNIWKAMLLAVNSEAAPLPALPDLAKPPIQNGLSHSTLSPQLEKEKGSVAICRGGSDRPHNTATCNPVDTDHCDSTGQGLGQGKWRMLGSMEESHLSQI